MQYQQQGSYTQSADRAERGNSRVVGAVGLCGPRISIETLSGVDAVIILNTGIGFLEHLWTLGSEKRIIRDIQGTYQGC